MPEIARFYALAVYMYYDDHAPPHVHVKHGRAEAMYAMAHGRRLRGEIPPTGDRLIRDWIELRRQDLEENWRRMESHMPLFAVAGPDGRD